MTADERIEQIAQGVSLVVQAFDADSQGDVHITEWSKIEPADREFYAYVARGLAGAWDGLRATVVEAPAGGPSTVSAT